MKAMILAAGYGNRLRPLTETTPKPLLKAAGKPLIEYHIERLAAAGVRQLVINTFWLGEQIQNHIGDGSRFDVQVQWVPEPELLDTGGAIYNALSLLGDDPLLVINGDIWTDYPLQTLVNRQWPNQIDAHLVMVPNPIENPSGDFEITGQRHISYPRGGQTYTYSGIRMQRPETLAQHCPANRKFSIWDVLGNSISSGRVSGELFTGSWWDIGTVKRLDALNILLGPVDAS